MNKQILDIVEVKTYYEKAVVSSNNSSFKIAVLKVKFSDGNWDTIFRSVSSHRALSSDEIGFIEQYKTLDMNQIRQISCLLGDKEQKIFGLYLKKYLKYDLNINTFIAKRNMRLYVENKKTNILEKTKDIFQTIATNLRKAKLYFTSSRNATNI